MTQLTDLLRFNQLLRVNLKLAQDGGAMHDAASGIKDYISSQWDSEHPVASIVNFMAPAVLFRFNPILGILYEVAEALGFDSRGFWESVGANLLQFMHEMIGTGHTPTPEEFQQKATELTDQNFDDHFTGTQDNDKLADAARKAEAYGLFSKDTNHANDGQVLANVINQAIIKEGSILTRPLGMFFRRFLPGLLRTGFYALFLNSATGAAKGLIGIPSEKSPSDSGSGGSGSSKTRAPIYSLPLNKNLLPDLTEHHNNNMNGIWVESGNIQNIQDYLISWILQAYPTLKNEKEQIVDSSAFIEVENAFRNRNTMANNLGVYSVPRPYQSKLDVVSYIVNGYLKNRPA